MMANPDAVACALFLLAAFVLAGVAQTVWLRSPRSQALAVPIDGGLTFRGRRLFGEHKTVRGVVVMVPAAAAAFVVLAILSGGRRSDWLWPLSLSQYAALGAWSGSGFMLGELPNSFLKRQLGIPPGSAAASRAGFILQFLGDRVDSALGMLLALTVAVPTPALTWAIVLLAGAPLHWAFSVLLFQLGVKARPA
jgi:CDP-2,3-bis-(O-geranylgeranyl)-sn-glycerol synthase